jgi:cell division septum initiation protein DivIVA
MNASNPRDAQAIVAAYLQAAEAHATADVYPNSLRDLPYSKELIREAFRTSVAVLVKTDQLTPELRDYLEVAYVSLADYVDDECATLLREYAHAGQQLAADRRLAREKVNSEAWRRLSEQSRLAGELAREISAEAERLRAEFRSWQRAAPEP